MKMLSCESHSCGAQGYWPVEKDSRSVRGIARSVQMIWPVRRCHQRSGSLKRSRTVRTARATRVMASITGKENNRRRTPPAESDNFRSLLLHEVLDQAMEISSGDMQT